MKYIDKENPHVHLPKTKIEIDVTADFDGTKIIYSHQERRKPKGDPIDLPEKTGPYALIFYLDDNTKLKLRFDASGPFFCKVGSAGGCPTSIGSDQIVVDKCKTKELTIVDWNYGAKADLWYRLNFTNKDLTLKDYYDPIIRNGGGTKPPITPVGRHRPKKGAARGRK